MYFDDDVKFLDVHGMRDMSDYSEGRIKIHEDY